MKEITFQKVLATSTVSLAGAELGDRAQTPDGRQWIYVKANEALSLGHALTRIADTDVDTVSSSNGPDGQRTRITEGSAGWTVGTYDYAYGLVNDGTGAGQFFKIKTNTSDTLALFEDYVLGTALAVADSDIIIARPYLAEKTAITVLNQIPVGIAQVAFAANDYGWALTRGIGTVVAGAALVANEQCTPGDDTEGEVIGISNGETPDDISTFGRCVAANTSADKAAMVDVLLY